MHLFYEEINIDDYLVKHKYGLVKDKRIDEPYDITMTGMHGLDKDNTFINQKRLMKRDL